MFRNDLLRLYTKALYFTVGAINFDNKTAKFHLHNANKDKMDGYLAIYYACTHHMVPWIMLHF